MPAPKHKKNFWETCLPAKKTMPAAVYQKYQIHAPLFFWNLGVKDIFNAVGDDDDDV